ncbi:MAG: hypothetical protein AAGA30_03370 [Planctomycetota bacterium]
MHFQQYLVVAVMPCLQQLVVAAKLLQHATLATMIVVASVHVLVLNWFASVKMFAVHSEFARLIVVVAQQQNESASRSQFHA